MFKCDSYTRGTGGLWLCFMEKKTGCAVQSSVKTPLQIAHDVLSTPHPPHINGVKPSFSWSEVARQNRFNIFWIIFLLCWRSLNILNVCLLGILFSLFLGRDDIGLWVGLVHLVVIELVVVVMNLLLSPPLKCIIRLIFVLLWVLLFSFFTTFMGIGAVITQLAETWIDFILP